VSDPPPPPGVPPQSQPPPQGGYDLPPPDGGYGPPHGGYGYPPIGYAVPQWKRIQGPAKAMRILLIILAAVSGLSIPLGFFSRSVVSDFEAGSSTLDDALAAVQGYYGFGLLRGALTLAVAVLTMVWMYRLATNHDLLGRPGTRFGRGWAIGGWFIPFANFVIPVLQFRQLWQGSDWTHPPHDPEWRRAPVAAVLWVWWIVFVVSWVVSASASGTFSAQPETDSELVREFDQAFAGLVASDLFTIAAAVLYLVVISQLTQRQEYTVMTYAGQPGPASPSPS
jgi:Domain of unknown function (DUF4328)